MAAPLPWLLVLPMTLMIASTRGSEVTCTAVTTDTKSSVTCQFHKDINKDKENFIVQFFDPPTTSDPDTVVACNWLSATDLYCSKGPGVSINKTFTDRLTVTGPSMVGSLSGQYRCQVVPQNGVPVHPCDIIYVEPSTSTSTTAADVTKVTPCTSTTASVSPCSSCDRGESSVPVATFLAVVIVALAIIIILIVLLIRTNRQRLHKCSGTGQSKQKQKTNDTEQAVPLQSQEQDEDPSSGEDNQTKIVELQSQEQDKDPSTGEDKQTEMAVDDRADELSEKPQSPTSTRSSGDTQSTMTAVASPSKTSQTGKKEKPPTDAKNNDKGKKKRESKGIVGKSQSQTINPSSIQTDF